jgi:hypothetical protein
VSPRRASGGRGAAPSGRPRRSSIGAALLTALAEAGESLTSREARRRGALVLARYEHQAPVTEGTWHSAASVIGRAGLIARVRRGRNGSDVEITEAGLAERGETTRLLAVHAEDLGRFKGFAWATERGQDYQRGAQAEPVAALMEAVG